MQRVITKTIGKNFQAGDLRDYSLITWREIARSAKQDLDAFSKPILTADSALVDPQYIQKKPK